MRKRITLYLIFCCLPFAMLSGQDSIRVEDITLSYSALNKPLPVVLNDLVVKSGVNIIYSESKLQFTRKVTIQAKNEKLTEILNVVLKPYRLSYQIVNGNIVINRLAKIESKALLTINGYIRDKNTGEALPYATIKYNNEPTQIVANENGYYSMTIPEREYEIVASFVGYEPLTIKRFIKENGNINLELEPGTVLNEVLISGNNSNSYLAIGSETLEKQRLHNATFLGGESDVMRLVGMSSGVSTGADGFGGISVRGGDYDQNLFLLDGVPVHNTGHALGLISIFNSQVIQSAQLHKSGFSPKYGGKLSSILDIRTREGNNKKFSGQLGLSTIASNVSLEGPIIKNKASFLVSYRRTFADPWIKALSEYQANVNDDEGQASYFFDDLYAKLNIDINPQNKLFLSYYSGQDKFSSFRNTQKTIERSMFEDKNREQLDWGNQLATLHLNSQWTKRMFGRFMLYGSRWNYENFNYSGYYIDRDSIDSEIYQGKYESSNIESYGARYELDLMLSQSQWWRFGIAANDQSFSPSARYINNLKDGSIYPVVPAIDDLANQVLSTSILSREYIAFIESIMNWGNTELSLGVHSSYYIVDKKNYLSLQPRVRFSTGDSQSKVVIAVEQMRQYNSILTNNQLGFPSDLWVTSTGLLPPADSWNFSAGVSSDITDLFNLSGELYYKTFTNLVSLNEGLNVPFGQSDLWELNVPRGEGTAYGAEINMKRRFFGTNVDANYTYSSSNRFFEDLNNGIEFDYRYERPHMFKLNLSKAFGEKADINLNFFYATGNPVTIPTSEIVEIQNTNGDSFLSVVYDGKNNSRLRDYFRLDLGFNFYTNYSFGKQKFFIGVYNMLNNSNPLYFEIKRNKFEPNIFELHSISVIPILPAINYSLTF